MNSRYRAWRESQRVLDEGEALAEATFWNDFIDESPVSALIREVAQRPDPLNPEWSPACPDCGDEQAPTCPTCEGQTPTC